jgi:O-antigen/teichoic acid export membrane protein
MNAAKRIAKNTFALLISGVFSQLLHFAAIVYLARVLGPENFGKISFATAIIIYFTMATHWGLPLLGTREIARDKTKINEYLSNIIILRLGLATISFIALLTLLYFLNKPDDVKSLILVYGTGLFFSALMPDWLFQGLEKMEYIGLSKSVLACVYTSLIFIFIKGQHQLLIIPYFHVVASSLSVALLIAIFLLKFGLPKFRFDAKFLNTLFVQSVPLGISLMMIQIIYSIDTIMLGFLRNDTEIGHYNAAYKVILPLIMVGSVYFDAVFPVASRYYTTSLDSLQKLQAFNAKLISSVSFPLAFGGTMLAMPIMNMVYGADYNNGVVAFRILVWVAALIYLNMIYARGMWACNKQNEYVKIVAGQAIANIFLNLCFIPRWGITGAALSTLFAELLGFFFYYQEFNKIVFVPIHKYLLKPLTATLIMVLFIFSIWNLQVLLIIVLSIPIYFLSLYFLKGIKRDEIKNLMNK